MNAITKPLAGVERERERVTILGNKKAELFNTLTHTHTICSLENKTSIFPYVLLRSHARDG